jgi:hypothetical protein
VLGVSTIGARVEGGRRRCQRPRGTAQLRRGQRYFGLRDDTTGARRPRSRSPSRNATPAPHFRAVLVASGHKRVPLEIGSQSIR